MRLPRPAAWASAVALFVFAMGVSAAMALIIPVLFGLIRMSPRLGWLGMLVVWLAPIGVAAPIHAVLDRVLGRGDATPATSLWAGFVAWAVIIVVTMTTAFIMLVLDPPRGAPDALWDLVTAVTRDAPGVARSALWIVLAAYAYELQGAARDA